MPSYGIANERDARATTTGIGFFAGSSHGKCSHPCVGHGRSRQKTRNTDPVGPVADVKEDQDSYIGVSDQFCQGAFNGQRLDVFPVVLLNDMVPVYRALRDRSGAGQVLEQQSMDMASDAASSQQQTTRLILGAGAWRYGAQAGDWRLVGSFP